MLETCLTIYFNSDQNRLEGSVLYSTESGWNQVLSDQVREHGFKEQPIVVVDAQAALPPYWQSRLLRPLTEDPSIRVLTALSTTLSAISPLAPDDHFSASVTDLDAWIYCSNDPQVFLTQALNPQCFAARSLEDLRDPGTIHAVTNLLVQSDAAVGAAAEPTGDQHPLPAHPLASSQWRFQTQSPWPALTAYPGLDSTPVCLHVVMDWGGGVHQWLKGFAEQHPEMHHLVLTSKGEFYRQSHGERFVLQWHDCEGPALREWHFSDPIRSTAISHPEYQKMFRQLCERWGVGLVVVSSLIGHAMDCLDTGLPTLRVLHDYFPHWPSLNARLDAETIDQGAVSEALAASANEPFGAITAANLQAWQTANNWLLGQDNVILVAPDDSVKQNLLKLPASSCYESIQVIPHAVNALKAVPYQADQSPFTVVIPGRLSPPKGQDLVLATVEELLKDESVRLLFLGAGKSAALLPEHPRLTVVEHYAHDQLSELLQEHAPQLAWLASSASESFSYVLSEMQMSGIPVMAQPAGALKNRINDGQNGFLVEARVDAVVEKIKALQKSPERLDEASREGLAAVQATPDAVAQAYGTLIDAVIKPPVVPPWFGLRQPDQQWQLLFQEKAEISTLKSVLKSLEEDVQEKTQWAQSVHAQNEHLTENLALQDKEVKHLSGVVEDVSQQLTDAMARHEAEAKEMKGHIQRLDEQAEVDRELIAQLTDEKAQLAVQLDQTQQQLQATLNSRSWRMTKPFRRATTYLRHKRNAVKFRWSQLVSIPKRLRQSLKTRGMKKTLVMAKNKIKKNHAPEAIKPQPLATQYEPLSIKPVSEPLVSVIIPVYNHFQHTYHCLNSLARLQENASFEIIVVDDCSTDETPELMQLITGVKNHRQAENGGFIESCNTGAKLAQGKYLLFLNNDTEVLPGGIDALLDTFDERVDAGLVGSQLLYPDGRLQEAGGIVFSDASGWNYGRLESPEEPAYQHLRAVSYCSGASIMIKKALFETLGCLDTRYKPAYYEDTDLAFAVRAHGLQVYYQPLSRVIHFEGVSSGTDLSSGTKRYQVINQEKFLNKWSEALAHQPQPGSDIEVSRFQSAPKRVLIFDACTPTPDQDSGSLRMMNLMQIFNELGYHVGFIPENMVHFDQYTTDLQAMGVECVYGPKYATPLDYLKAKGRYYDLVILSRYYVARPLMGSIREYAPNAKIWFDTVDLHYLRETRMAELSEDPSLMKAAEKTKEQELGVASDCDLTLVVSPYEQNVLAQTKPDLNVSVLSNIHAVYGSRLGYAERQDLMFIGGYQHTPNVDGILWFVEAIWPQIHAALPDVKLHVIGSKAPQEVVALGEQKNIEFHGFVDDIEPFMESVRLAVAPLRFGAGVKGKVNMSMSYGQPVIGTRVAVEGMHTQHGHDVMMADKPDDFAAAVIEVYQDQVLWEQLSQGSLDNVTEWFSFDAAKSQIQKLLKQPQQT